MIFTADAVGDPEAIVIQSVCNVVSVRQLDHDAATIAFYLYQPLKTSTPVMCPPNRILIFRNTKGFRVGEIPAFIAAASGSIDFSQLEGVEER